MNKEEVQEAKDLLQRLKNEVFIATHSHEEQRAAIDTIVEALPDEENHVQRVVELAEATTELLEQIRQQANSIDAQSLNYEEALSLARATNNIEDSYYRASDLIHKRIEKAEANNRWS